MANREREVGFLIKAKQQSKKAIDDTADALEHLDKIQADFGKTASKTGSLVERLQGAMADLDREIQGLSALNTVAANMDKAAQAVGRLDAEVRKSADSEEQLMRQMDAAAVATARAQKNAQFLKEARDQQRKVVAALTADEKKNTAVYEQQKSLRDDLNKAYTRAEAAVSRAQNAEDKLYSSLLSTENATNHLRDAFNEANAELSEIATLANRASSALGGVEATQEAVARASAKATAELERVNNAIRSSSGGGSARLLQGGAVAGAANSSDAIQALKAYKAAEVELQRLTEEIARAGGASVEMQRDLDVQTAAVAKAAREYQALRDSLVDAATARKSLKSAGDVTASGTSGVANVPSSVPSSMREATKEGNSLRDAFKGIYGESRQAMSLLQRFRGEVLSLTSSFVGLYAAIEGIGSVIQTAIAYQSVYNKLGVVFGDDVAGTRAEVSFLASEANRLGIAFTTLATNYSSFAVAANGANFSLEDTRKISRGRGGCRPEHHERRHGRHLQSPRTDHVEGQGPS
jgi:chromosome segregation ATPase